MRSSSALVQRSRPSNNVPRMPRRLLLSPAGVCVTCLARLRLAHSLLPGNHVAVAGYTAGFHSTASSSLAAPRGGKSYASKNLRKAVEGNRALKEIVRKPSRMTLSERVGRAPQLPKRDGNRDGGSKAASRRPEDIVDTGGGMNRRTFRPRSDDKQQYSRAREERRQELREATSRPSPSRFEQKPTPSWKQRLQSRGTGASSRQIDEETSERRNAAAKLDSGRSEIPEKHARDQEKRFIRPPVRRFGQMKHIASLDHVSSRTRELTHAAEERFSSFETFDLLPQTLEALYKDGLRGLEDVTPTPVQSLVIPQLLDKRPAPPLRPLPVENKRQFKVDPLDENQFYRDSVAKPDFKTYLIAAETGSGKTLAYVLPLMNTIKLREQLKKEEEEQEEQNRAEILKQKGSWMFDIPAPPVTQDVSVGKPFAVILVPTSELVFQVGSLLKSLSYIIKLRTEMISKEFSGNVIRNRLFRSSTPDIIVGTPFMIDRITEANPSMLHRTSHIVVDEADSLFDRSFSTLTAPIIDRAINLEKLILCSATIPKSLDAYINRKYPDCKRLVTANLHAIPRRIQLQVVDCMKDPYKGKKILACAHLLDNIAKDDTEPGYTKRVVVFVNERETTAEVTSFLREKGFDAVEINRDSDSRKILESFTGEKEGSKAGMDGRRKGGMKVLVTTDLASRGVDTKNVKNVILYDVPYTSIDFIHRLGRTGRMGRRGRAWILTDKDSNQEYVKEVRKTMFLGQALI